MDKTNESLGRRQKKSTRDKIAKAMTGSKNPAYKSGQRSYRNKASAKPGQLVHHCYSLDTEYLTTGGWKTINDIKDEKIFQVDESGIWTLINSPVKVFTEDDEYIHFKCSKVDLKVTKDHKMLTTEGIETAERCLNTRRNWLVGYSNNDEISPKYNISWLKFLTAIVCDGTICHSGIRFNFSRGYKIQEMHKLLNELHLHHTIRYLTPKQHQSKWTKKDLTEFNINSVKLLKIIKADIPDKMLPYKFLTLSLPERRAILEEYLLFDGYEPDGDYKGIKYWMSKNKQNMDIIQALLVLSGSVGRVYNYNGFYKVSSSDNLKTIPAYSEDGDIKLIKEHNAKFGCLTTKTGFLIVRRNGKALVCGNSDGNRKNNKRSNLKIVSKKNRGTHDKAHSRGSNFRKSGGTKTGAHTKRSHPKRMK